MWYTGNFALEAILLAEVWEFKVKTMKGFTWVKLNKLAKERSSKAIKKAELSDTDGFLPLLNAETRMNGGNYTRSNSEDCFLAIRGKGLQRKDASIKQVIYSCLGEHSQKPKEVHYQLKKLYGDVKRIELFARDKVQGWDLWGNEAPEKSMSF
ncbi:MAG: MT-A70 family methyltransferase [Candidatus Phlomobacter fragariae]